MRSATWWLCLAVAVAGFVFANGATVRADEDDGPKAEQRERMAPRYPAPQPEMMRPGMPGYRGMEPGYRAWRCLRFVVLWLAVVHVLLATWMFTDIRKRGEGHGIFIVLVLLAGLPAAILYALVRIGDAKKS